MKKQIFFLLAIVSILVMTIWSCNHKKENIQSEELNLTKDITPVQPIDSSHSWIIDMLKDVPVAERMDFIDKHWPNLKNDVLVFVKNSGYIPQDAKVDSIIFSYGNGKGTSNDKYMQKFKGKFENELIAGIYIDGSRIPLAFFVKCTNGLSEVVETDALPIGTKTDFVFTIQKGEGICNYVGYQTAIMLARNFNLIVFIKRDKSQNISYDQAFNLKNETDRIQVTVQVYPGDVFDLENMTYNGQKPKVP